MQGLLGLEKSGRTQVSLCCRWGPGIPSPFSSCQLWKGAPPFPYKWLGHQGQQGYGGVGFETDLHLIINLVTPCSLTAHLGIRDSLVGGEVEGRSPALGRPVSHSLGSPFWLNCKLSLRPEEELSELLLKEKVPRGSAISLLNSCDQTSGVPQR